MMQGETSSGSKGLAVPIATACCVLVSIIAVLVGQLSGWRVYYLTSVVIIACTIIPFLVSFESSKPQAGELSLLAVICAFAVASRIAFFWLPQFKPMAGIVMIAGVALGARAGFLAGSLSALVSNFFFGQGYWTPFQMIAFGLAGLVFGLLAKTRYFSRDSMSVAARIVLSVLGFFYVLCILGPMLDTCSVLIMVSEYTPQAVLAIYLAGVPMNAVHGIATAVTLMLLLRPITSRIARVQKKFGL